MTWCGDMGGGERAARLARPRGGVGAAIATGCFVTVIAQVESRLSAVFTLLWLSLALYLAVLYRSKARMTGLPLLTVGVAVLLGVSCSACCLLTGETGYLTGFFQLYLKCLLMYLIGVLVSSADDMTPGQWRTVLAAYVAASCVYMAWAWASYFPGFSAWLSSSTYLFAAKNSLGQICGVASVVLAVAGAGLEDGPRKAALWGGSALMACCVLLIQCRTAALAVALALIVLLASDGKRKALVALAIALAVALALSPTLRTYASHALFLDKYAGADANAMSSGRLAAWGRALANLDGRWLLGLGKYYVDNAYVNLLANLGLVGLALFMAVWAPRVVVNLKRGLGSNRDGGGLGTLWQLVALLTVFYLVESLLEGYPPFGPGTCSFVFWMLSGYLDGIESGGEAAITPRAGWKKRLLAKSYDEE